MRLLLVTILCTLVFISPVTAQPTVNFAATWQRTGVARLTWQQPTDTRYACLTRIPATGNAVPLDCYHSISPGAQVVILLGATAPVDGNYRPQAGDTFMLQVSDETYTSALRAILRLPVFYV